MCGTTGDQVTWLRSRGWTTDADIREGSFDGSEPASSRFKKVLVPWWYYTRLLEDKRSKNVQVPKWAKITLEEPPVLRSLYEHVVKLRQCGSVPTLFMAIW